MIKYRNLIGYRLFGIIQRNEIGRTQPNQCQIPDNTVVYSYAYKKKANLGSITEHIIGGMKENFEQGWVERARQAEPAAIAELYRRYWRAARATAYGVTADLDLAEDAASEAFCAALDGLADLRDSQRFGPWLRTIVLRTAGRLKATKSKADGVEPQTLPDAQSLAPSDHSEQKELIALVHEAVRNLSETLREAMSPIFICNNLKVTATIIFYLFP